MVGISSMKRRGRVALAYLHWAIAAIAVATLAVFGSVAHAAQAAQAPSEIKLGTLYASARAALPASRCRSIYGLKLWMDQKNAEGGVYVKAFDKKIPLKLVAYDDQSSTATAATLYNQLITQDKVDHPDRGFGLGADLGRGADRARPQDVFDRPDRHRRNLLHQGQPLHRADRRSGLQRSGRSRSPISSHRGRERRSGSSASPMLYATNDFTGTQANAVRKFIKESNSGLEIVYDQGVPTNTSNYTVLLNNIRASQPRRGDRARLRRQRHRLPAQRAGQRHQVQASCSRSIPGSKPRLLEKNVGTQGAQLRVHLRAVVRRSPTRPTSA